MPIDTQVEVSFSGTIPSTPLLRICPQHQGPPNECAIMHMFFQKLIIYNARIA
jgi:hypothetical protein